MQIFWKTTLIFCCAVLFCQASEPSNQELESRCLQNIRQITSPSMGFERAGEAYFSPDGKTIAFQAVPTGQEHYQIYKLDLEEGIPFMLSTGYGACTCAYFRPDNERIIFASSHEAPPAPKLPTDTQTKDKNYKWDLTPYMNIYETELTGSNLTPLTTGSAYHAECAYSPDGSQIVYASNEDGSMNLYTMNADGSAVRQITHTNHCYNGGPFFSPDGKHIVFRADRDKRDYLQIYMIDINGSNERQLTNNGAVNWAPYWHPDGNVIAFTTSLHGHRQYELYLLNIDTNVQYRLTHNPSFDGLPSFSKDGTQILWTSKRGPDNTSQVFIADFIMPAAMISKE